MPSTGDALSRVLALSADAGKISKDSVNYRPSTDAARRCGVCYMFSNGACTIVEGRIDPRDVCDRWVPDVPEQGTRRWSLQKIKAASLDSGQSLLLASGFVEGYERLEKGKLEHVSGYAEHHLPKPKVVGPALEGGTIPAAHGIVVVRAPEGHFVEVQRSRLWLHPSEGKPGPLESVIAGQKITWRYNGKTHTGTIAGPYNTALPAGAKVVAAQGTFVDSNGQRHWGWYGGAGLLLHHTDEAGTTRYLLQRRAYGVQHGGTWSTPGGAIDRPGGLVETPATAAFREAEEEGWGNVLGGAAVTGVRQEHFGGQPGEPGTWTYHTVSAALPDMVTPSGKGSHAGEATGAKWVTPEEMAKLPLHPDFVATANKLGRPADAPNPKPSAPTYKSHGRHPLVRDDYKAGRRVTWRYKSQQAEGIVTGPAGKTEKGKYPEAYTVKMDNGQPVNVKWADLRLHPSENPKDAAKAAEWEKKYSGSPVFPAGTSLAQKGKSSIQGPVIKAHSLVLPGLTHTVPATIGDKAVQAVYEHPHSSSLVLRLQGGSGVRLINGKPAGSVQKLNIASYAESGWKSIPFSPPQQDAAQSSPLGKVVEAAKDLPPF